jgi:hypothetical protein
MKTKLFIALGFLVLGLTGQALAQEETFANVQYPVAELGFCQDKASCRSFCDQQKNKETCLDFAQKNNLMSEDEVEKAKRFLAIGEKGPGNCEGAKECEAFCSNSDHIEECITFAEENNLIPPEELAQARKARDAIRRGFKPPPCGGKEQCEAYCDQPEHMEECIVFGKEAGFIQDKELEDAQKMLSAIKRGVNPPPCRGKQACDQYCSEPENMESCMTFAMEAGFMTEKEKVDAQKMLMALKKGFRPPNCRGKEECDVYCQQEEHLEECTNFAQAAGFITPEQAALTRKTKGKGPGGCRGEQECEAFCQNQANEAICFNFARENGLIPEEELRKMDEARQMFLDSLNQAPPEVRECLNNIVDSEVIEKIRNGSIMPPSGIGEQMGQCYEKMIIQEQLSFPQGPPIINQQPCEGENCQSGPVQELPQVLPGEILPQTNETILPAPAEIMPPQPLREPMQNLLLEPMLEPTPVENLEPARFLINLNTLIASAAQVLVNFFLPQ